MNYLNQRYLCPQVISCIAIAHITAAKSWLADKESLASCGKRARTCKHRNIRSDVMEGNLIVMSSIASMKKDQCGSTWAPFPKRLVA